MGCCAEAAPTNANIAAATAASTKPTFMKPSSTIEATRESRPWIAAADRVPRKWPKLGPQRLVVSTERGANAWNVLHRCDPQKGGIGSEGNLADCTPQAYPDRSRRL